MPQNSPRKFLLHETLIVQLEDACSIIKILVLIGAGSVKFTLGLVQDLIADGGALERRLVDINNVHFLTDEWRKNG